MAWRQYRCPVVVTDMGDGQTQRASLVSTMIAGDSGWDSDDRDTCLVHADTTNGEHAALIATAGVTCTADPWGA